MNSRVIVVKATWDAEAEVWYITSSDIDGLNLEAESIEGMIKKLPGAVSDLIECENDELEYDVPIELIATASARIKAQKAA